MIDLLINTRSRGKIDNLSLDATLSDNIDIKNDVTSLPVEDGSDINDHIIKKPIKVTIRGVISNSPLLSAGNLTAYTDSFRSSSVGQLVKSTGTRVDDALTELLRLSGHGQTSLSDATTVPIITIVTGLKIYTNMVMTSLNIPRDRNTGDALRFTAEFVSIHRAALNYVDIQPPVKDTSGIPTQTAKVSDIGRSSKTEVKPKVSILAGLFNKLATGN